MKKHLALAAVLLAVPVAHAGSPALDMGRAARNFLKGLDAKQKASAFFKFPDDEREYWHFIPRDR